MLSIGSALGGKVEQLELDACATREVDRIADQIHDAAYGLLPYCAKMDEKVGFGCGSLGGDGDVAATFAATVLATAGSLHRRGPSASCCRRASGNRGFTGAARRDLAGAAHLHHAVPRPVFDPGGPYRRGTWRLDGQRAGAAAGQQVRGGGACSGRRLIAPSVQVWRIDGGEAKLEHWTIGKFAPVEMEPPSPPPMPQ